MSMHMEKQVCYRALTSHDARFDGIFFTCVSTTGIYCRPVCPTPPPKFENCSFVATAPAAEKLGYRPCLRCRPELAPFAALVDNAPAHMLRRTIEETLLADQTFGHIAATYAMSERQLRRIFHETYGVSPQEYLTTTRLLFAKQLLQDTMLSVTDVAYSAGFNTLGRLTANMQSAYGFTPSELRKKSSGKVTSSLTLCASYRPPYDWDSLLTILAGRATPTEYIRDNVYHRKVKDSIIRVTNDEYKHQLRITIPVEISGDAHTIMRSVRRLFDLNANPLAISEALENDLRMSPLIARYPGIRVPGAWDNFELLIRVIVGQQISVAGATTIMRRIVENIGATPSALSGSSPEAIAQLGMPLKRATTIHTVSLLVHDNTINLDQQNPRVFYEQLIAIPGIGPWTAEYLCMRVLHWPDAFPAGDLGVQKALGMHGKKVTERVALAESQAWRPWRSYATMLLWKSISNQGG